MSVCHICYHLCDLSQEYEYQEGIIGADESAQSNPDIPVERDRVGISHDPSDAHAFYQPFTFAFEVETVPSADVVPLDKLSSVGKYATIRKPGEPVYQTIRLEPAATAYAEPLTVNPTTRFQYLDGQPEFAEEDTMQDATYGFAK
jgi:hypothetical protein